MGLIGLMGLVTHRWVVCDFALQQLGAKRHTTILNRLTTPGEASTVAYLHTQHTGHGTMTEREVLLFGRLCVRRDYQGCVGWVRGTGGGMRAVPLEQEGESLRLVYQASRRDEPLDPRQTPRLS